MTVSTEPSTTTATTSTITTKRTQTSMQPPPPPPTNNTNLCCMHTSSDLCNLHDNEKYEDASYSRTPTMMTTTTTTPTTAQSEGAISRASSARLSRLSSSHQAFSAGVGVGVTSNSSSWLGYSTTEIVIEDQQNEHEPTSALLDYCKRKFLRPYVAILSLVGLNPISTDTTTYRACCSYIQALIVLCILLFGYFLRYLCAYRGDRGFTKYREIQPNPSPDDDSATSMHTIGDLLFGYVIPSTLNMLGFLSAIVVCKVIDHEQLQNLIERVFLMSSKPNHLCRMLWLYLGCGFLLFLMLFAYACCAVLMQPAQIIKIIWIADILKDWEICMRITLLTTVFVQDLVEIVILCGYYIECYLLRVHLETLSHKLLMHSIDCLDWMREVLEFRKQLERLNQRAAVPVCFLIVMNLAYAFAGFVYLFKDFDFHYCALKVVILNIVNVLLWLFLGMLPFFMAASVTRACQAAQANGHQIRVRPFVYHNTSNDDLDSTLLFASSLDMSAKLFRMPVQSNYLCFAILVVTIVILTLGMCLNLTALGHM